MLGIDFYVCDDIAGPKVQRVGGVDILDSLNLMPDFLKYATSISHSETSKQCGTWLTGFQGSV